MLKKALVSVTVPGTVNHISSCKSFLDLLEKNEINYNQVDSVSGWGCLDQDWVEFHCDIETSWGFCELKFDKWTEDIPNWDTLFQMFKHGTLLMGVYYRDSEGELVPHV